MNCLHCGAPTTNGLALCDLCQRKATTDLEFLPVYFRNLARWRPGRAGSRPVPGSRVLYDGERRGDGTGDRISDRLDEAMNTLTTWARALTDDRSFARPLTYADAVLTGDLSDVAAEQLADDPAVRFAWLCAAFDHHLTTVATLESCGEFVRNLSRHEATLRSLTETSVPGWYAGTCRRRLTMEDVCGARTYVVPGLTWVTCHACGTTTYARDHLDAVLDEASDWLARPKPMAEALVALLDSEQSVPRLYDRIRKWESLGWLNGVRRLDVDGDPVGPKRYRLGDVLALALGQADAPTRAVRMTTA
jgi:hypothetical protein